MDVDFCCKPSLKCRGGDWKYFGSFGLNLDYSKSMATSNPTIRVEHILKYGVKKQATF